jgi:tetratricopeptide (TPR) repeat protein
VTRFAAKTDSPQLEGARRPVWPRCAHVVLAAAGVLALAACTTVTPPGVRPSPDAPQPEASADYDVLVGEFAAREGQLLEARNAFLRAVEKDPESAYLHLRAAMLSARIEDLDLALLHTERAVELDPEHEPARILLARLLRHQGDILGVERALRGADGAPVSLRAGVLLVQLMLENQRRAEALGTATALVEAYPEEMSAYYALASVHEDAGDRGQVEAVVLQAIAAFPEEVALYTRLAQLRRAAGDVDGEIAAYRLLLERRPDHLGTLRMLAEVLVKQDDTEGAARVYEQALGYYPDELLLLQPLIGLDVQRGDLDRAAARLEEVVRRRPRDYELIYMLGLVHLERGEVDLGIAELQRIPPQHDAYRDASIRIAQLYEERGDFAQALAVIEELRVLHPDKRLDFYTAGLRVRSGDLRGGVSLMQEHLDANPDDPDALYQMGLVHDSARERDEAIRWMRASLERDPENAHALNYIGYTLAERGEDLDEAEALIRRALELAPEDGYITDSLGWVFYMRAVPLVRRGRIEDARTWILRALETLERAAALSGGDPVISEHLGDVHLLAGDKQRALGFYEQAVDLEPRPDEQPDLLDKLEALRAELGGT